MTTSDSHNNRLYTQEDIQQILQIAIARQTEDKEFSYQDLVEIAAELEIPPESLQLAEKDWQSQQGELANRLAFNNYRKIKLQKRFGNYAIVNTFLMMLDFSGGHDLSWSLYILLLWGLKLGLDSWNILHTKGEDYERAFQNWYRQRQIRQSINGTWNKLLKALST